MILILLLIHTKIAILRLGDICYMNLGGYTNNDYNESSGNIILKEILHNEKLIFTHFDEQDKTPNFDGFFEILENKANKSVPIGRFDVQIKTLNHNYKNENKKINRSQYKYSCDTKIFNAVKKSVTLNPCYLFMVDTKKRRIFAKYISLKFVLMLDLKDEDSKVIYFNDDDEIVNIADFYQLLKNIYFEKKEQLTHLEKNKFLTNDNMNEEELSLLQIEFDYLNNLFDSELSYIKCKLFPKVWKFGLAYLKTEQSLGLGIYWICRGTNGEYFKKLSKYTQEECMYMTFSYSDKIDVHKMINGFIKSTLEKAFKHNIISLKEVTDEILFEISYYFLDTVSSISTTLEDANRPNTYYKDVEYVTVLESYYSALVQYSYERGKDIIQRYNVDVENARLLCDPMREISFGKDLIENRKHLDYLFKHPDKRTLIDVEIALHGNFEYSIIYDAILELKRRNITKIKRFWNSKSWSEAQKQLKTKGSFRIENGFLVEEYFENLKKLLVNLPHTFECFIRQFPDLKIESKYCFGFSNDDSWEVVSLYFDSKEFEVEFDDSIVKAANERAFDFIRSSGAKSISSGIYAHIFDLHFPMLTYINYLFINQVLKKYNIDKVDIDKHNICL